MTPEESCGHTATGATTSDLQVNLSPHSHHMASLWLAYPKTNNRFGGICHLIMISSKEWRYHQKFHTILLRLWLSRKREGAKASSKWEGEGYSADNLWGLLSRKCIFSVQRPREIMNRSFSFFILQSFGQDSIATCDFAWLTKDKGWCLYSYEQVTTYGDIKHRQPTPLLFLCLIWLYHIHSVGDGTSRINIVNHYSINLGKNWRQQ